METSAKSSMNVNDIFLAIGLFMRDITPRLIGDFSEEASEEREWRRSVGQGPRRRKHHRRTGDEPARILLQVEPPSVHWNRRSPSSACFGLCCRTLSVLRLRFDCIPHSTADHCDTSKTHKIDAHVKLDVGKTALIFLWPRALFDTFRWLFSFFTFTTTIAQHSGGLGSEGPDSKYVVTRLAFSPTSSIA